MMKTKTKIGLLVAALAMAASGVVCSAEEPANPYVQAAGKTLMTPFGLCVRTGYWTPALAEAQGALGRNCNCDPDIIHCEAGGEKVVLSADTLFTFNKSNLRPEGMEMLKELTSRMAGLNVDVVMINGYADRIGGYEYNLKLSDRRAEAVKNFLAENGVPAARIHAEGKGQIDPVVDCPNPSPRGEIRTFQELIKCLQPNRRAVIEVIGTRAAR
ncbi:MAG: OmpA family protein [Burkholderiales bacterium]|nr:OmpA family protein [Burkholderiales bacterium]